MTTQLQTLVRHAGDAPRERSTCGGRDRLISREDSDVAGWVHAIDIDGAREHCHKRATELYYIPPGVVHGARGKCVCWSPASRTSPMTICSIRATSERVQ